tara:strand:+ start:7871 stop:9058 length:1188 start_codon:yes stop_codon:yes gene_type:complete
MLTQALSHLKNLLQINSSGHATAPYDRTLFLSILYLIGFGFIMVSSASIVEVAQESTHNPFHFAQRHLFYMFCCVVVTVSVLATPMQKWMNWSAPILLLVGLLLILVLIVGTTVNGATRWLALGPVRIQIAELAKFAFTLYMASYLVRRYQEVQSHAKGFYKPIALLFIYSALLLLQPDLGSVVVLFVIAVSLLFLAGAKLRDFFILLFSGLLLIGSLAVLSPYRLRRMTAFIDPWQDPFGSGYQLTQSLMAYGRGGWFGEGLGNSIQKLKYLPEAHTDFIAAIIGEELGFMGVLFSLFVLFAVATKAMHLGKCCLKHKKHFEGFIAYGIGIWFFFQTLVNTGASMGLLPTKGLTLPFISYGGSSLLIMTAASMMLIRIGYETSTERNQKVQRTS